MFCETILLGLFGLICSGVFVAGAVTLINDEGEM